MQRLFYNEPLPNANHLDIDQVGWHGGRKSPVMPALLWESLGRGGRRNGWGGRIRTSTFCINSAASYQLDHAPGV